MYRLYEEAYKEHERASLDKYRRIFDEEFNLAFHKPKKDQCEICTSQGNNPTDEERESFEEHLSNKLKAREIKEQEKLAAKTPFKTVLLTWSKSFFARTGICMTTKMVMVCATCGLKVKVGGAQMKSPHASLIS
ncbi:tRNA uridine 5-carboxymethylaminomethyl modification enzyme mnmg [Plakobranchus ocellatus]|uniref:tRNA uridine 5-carboxymethylaminomethyl modification enzyme mnmg n=1 Tax=Plakobranchus ocellatus TaxID=259542 RepID=A0AAV4DPL5_9GAST|nr:tRNA uridine 5-carboxymethylaminomethyl modification enzyme mnmg [Plakobranchus ocellatus]